MGHLRGCCQHTYQKALCIVTSWEQVKTEERGHEVCGSVLKSGIKQDKASSVRDLCVKI